MICPNCRIENAAEGRYCRNCATPLRPMPRESLLEAETLDFPARSLRPGTTAAGRFQVIEELGKNALGTAYKVYDVRANETISLKIINPDLAADPASMERLRACIRRALKISHKNVCRVYHLGEDNDTRYITMEYIPGESLKSVMRMTKQLSVRTAVGIAGQICEGLSEAHRQGVVHGDLRLESIMIGRDGEARIMDLGFACLSAAAGDAGPEVSAGDQPPKDCASRPDIHALGAILYEMVTGEPPLPSPPRSLPPGKKSHLFPRDPREINGQVSKDLSRIILRCLDGDGEKPFETAEEVRAELARVAKDLPTTEHTAMALKPAPATDAASFGRKGWLMASALLILAIAGSLALAYFKSDKPQAGGQKKMLVVLPFENLGHSEDEYVTDGFTDEITNRLSALQGLGIISRTSAMRYKKTGKTLRQIGNELGVGYVLEGSVRWNRTAGGAAGPAGGRMRVTAQLIRVADDIHIWAETYEQDIENIFAVQAWIAEQVARKLDLTLLAPERQALEDRPTDNLQAYDYYLRGRKIEYRGWVEWRREDFLSAAEMFQKAVELDPKFAVAYSQLSIINSRCFFFGIDRTEQRLAQAGVAAQKALELNPKLPDAKMALAVYYYWGFLDYDRAVDLLESLRKPWPNLPLEMLGYIARRQGRWDDALKTLMEAHKLNPQYAQLAYEIGLCYMALRKYEDAESWMNRCLAINPRQLTAHLQKAAIAVLAGGDIDKAQSDLRSLPSHPLTDYARLTVDLMAGRNKEALGRLRSLDYEQYQEQHLYFHKDLAYAAVYHAMKNPPLQKAHAEKARAAIEKLVVSQPCDPRYRAALGLACAYLGHEDEAVEEAERAVNLYPESKDAAQGPIYLHNLARVRAITGEKEKAAGYLEHLLAVPYCEYLWDVVSVPSLRIDSRWASLRDVPRFQALLKPAPGSAVAGR